MEMHLSLYDPTLSDELPDYCWCACDVGDGGRYFARVSCLVLYAYEWVE